MRTKELDSSKIKILVCCHKQCELPKDDIFLPIQVGAAITDVDLGMQRDDQVNGMPCDNISAKNKSFCELTALYWAWKNIKKLYPDLEYIGVNHYRRFFNFDKSFRIFYIKQEQEVVKYSINKEILFSILKHGYSIVPKQNIYKNSLAVDYCCNHISDDYRTLKNAVKTLFPPYKQSFDEIFECNNKFIQYNMLVLSWNDFDSYCEWLFTILFDVEKKIDISHYNNIQKRIFGYMAERLFNVWVYHNSMRIKQIPIDWYTNQEFPPLFAYIKKRIMNNIYFRRNISLRIRIKFLMHKSVIGRYLIKMFQKIKNR